MELYSKKKFRKKNIGCTPSTISAINWCFDFEKELIILEDDCHPNLSFFNFSKKMLKLYKLDKKIFGICGSVIKNQNLNKQSYFFSRIAGTWGFATWKRAWQKFDIKINKLDKFKKEKILEKNF